MKATSSSKQPRNSNGTPRPRPYGGSRKRGATLVTAIFATFGLSLFVGSTALYVSSTYSLAWTRANSEAALLLAEGGVNREIQFISKQMQLMESPRSHSRQKLPGEPYYGYPATIAGMPGKVWVYTSEPGSNAPWKGKGPAQITCTAEVGGPRQSGQEDSWGPKVVRTLTVQTTPRSVFSAFAVFALDGAGNGNQPAIGITGGSKVTVVGNVGTNSRIQDGSGDINFTRAYNYNAQRNSGNQFDGDDTYSVNPPLVMPTVTEVLRSTIKSKPSDPWAWLASNNDNDGIREYSLLGVLTGDGTKNAGFNRSPIELTNKLLGTWVSVNLKPLTTKRVMIFPPGDYYFTGMNVEWDPTTEILIDNAGLTTPAGSNPEGIPVRFWFNGASKQDYLKIPVMMTNPEDAATFRLFYGKDGAVFNIIRNSNFPQKQYIISGCVYAVTSKLDPTTGQPADSTLKGTQIDFFGDSQNSGNSNVLYGSLIADRVAFHGVCSIIFPSAPMDQEDDPSMGIGYSSNCDREPCYGG